MAGLLVGSDFIRSDGAELPNSLSGWTLYWHWAGRGFHKPRVWAVTMKQSLGFSRRARMLMAENHVGSGGKFVDALVLCPPVSNPTPDECAIPQQYRFDVESIHSGTLPKKTTFSSLKEIAEHPVLLNFQLVTQESMSSAADRIAKEKTEASNAAQKRERSRAEEARQAQIVEAGRVKRTTEWMKNAKKGTTLMCGSGAFLARSGEPLSTVPMSCEYPGIGPRSISLTNMLDSGWYIENELRTPAPSMDGGTGFGVTLVLKKR